MGLTRREFLLGSAAGIGMASLPVGLAKLYAAMPASPVPAPSSFAYFSALSRISYGVTPFELARFEKLGIKAYLEEQLKPDDRDDALANQKIASATLHIEYKDNKNEGYGGRNEDRPLGMLNKTTEELWSLTDNTVKLNGAERIRPVDEVRAATWIRAVYSKWQLREVMVEFWHNHFNIHTSSNGHITASFPDYDRLMRRNCFGNFRLFLGEVAKSPAMLYFLNNDKSRASPANENYARELFELHTLGAGHYYNNIYNRWREVPGATEGKPIGYIDQDVYEAARAFTGWTVEDGTNTGRGTVFPKTGKFVYFDGWHDNYQKRVLGVEFDPNAPPMADGNKVLDLVASHQGTAINLCTKLCRRFVSDDPPDALVKRAAEAWLRNVHAPDQIAQVIQVIILSPEFAATQHQKVKRPFEFTTSFVRATGGNFTATKALINTLNGTGYHQFEWPSPTGHPDVAEFWLNTNSMLGNWNIVQNLSGGLKVAQLDTVGQTPPQLTSARDVAAYWYERLTGMPPEKEMIEALAGFLPYELEGAVPTDVKNGDYKDRLNNLVSLIAMLPPFQWRG